MPKTDSIHPNLIPSGEPEFYSVAELARAFGVHRRTVHDWIVKGRVKAIAIGRVLAIPAKEVKRLRELEEAV